MLTPNKIELLNYGLSEQAEVILTKMLNKRALDYSTLKELTAFFKDMSAESVQSAVEELHGRRFLYLIPKFEREVYAVNKEHINEYKDENGKKPTLKALEAKLDAMKKEWDQLDRVNIAHHAQYSIIRPYITRIRSLEMAEQNKRALEQSRQKTQTRKKNTYLE